LTVEQRGRVNRHILFKANTIIASASKGALMLVASGRLIFYLNRGAFSDGHLALQFRKVFHFAFRKDNYERYR
jgi:hypothetical protein